MNSLYEIFGKACILGRKRDRCMSRKSRTNQLWDLEEPLFLRRSRAETLSSVWDVSSLHCQDEV